MAACVKCGKETELYDHNIPLCIACLEEWETSQFEKKSPADHRRERQNQRTQNLVKIPLGCIPAIDA